MMNSPLEVGMATCGQEGREAGGERLLEATYDAMPSAAGDVFTRLRNADHDQSRTSS